MKRIKLKFKGKGQKLRLASQVFFALASIYTGWKFVLFVHHIDKGGISRPPGVEAFLPLSGLVGLKSWAITGILNSIHPAATVFLLAFLTMGLLLKRGFCSWVCPIGFLSEYLWKLGEKIFGENIRLPRALDYPLRSIKYIVLGLFLWDILFKMDLNALSSFIYGPYNRAADIKMLLFFERISTFSLLVIISFALLSIPIKNFWCRYLCPYGALLGGLSLLSPLKIKRRVETCTDCKLCTYACPSYIKVHLAKTVHSDECNACFRCVDVCPVPDTLNLKAGRKTVSPGFYLTLILLIFFGFTLSARLLHRWENSITPREYRYIIHHIDTSQFSHR